MHQAEKRITERPDSPLDLEQAGKALRERRPDTTDRPDQGLFGRTEDSFPGAFDADLLEQYKLYVQSAENVSVPDWTFEIGSEGFQP